MSTYAEVVAFVQSHHAQIAYSIGVMFMVANFAIKFLLYLHPLTDWVTIAEENPRVAALVRLMGALGIQPIAVLQALVDFVRGHASPGTMAFAKSFATSASAPLISPPGAVAAKRAPDGPHVEFHCRACGCCWALGGPTRCPRCDDPEKVPTIPHVTAP